jgi:hypothetical protein
VSVTNPVAASQIAGFKVNTTAPFRVAIKFSISFLSTGCRAAHSFESFRENFFQKNKSRRIFNLHSHYPRSNKLHAIARGILTA